MKAYLIPGSGEDIKDRDYSLLLDAYRSAGYEPEFFDIKWNYKTFDDYTNEVKSRLTKADVADSLLSGFSWGAMIALVVAAEYQNPRQLMLFSLSPYFAEDLPTLKKSWLEGAGKKRLANFAELNMSQLAQKIHCPTEIFVGTREGPESIRRARAASKQIPNSNLVILDGVGHDVADPRYIMAIRDRLHGPVAS